MVVGATMASSGDMESIQAGAVYGIEEATRMYTLWKWKGYESVCTLTRLAFDCLRCGNSRKDIQA